MKTTKIDGREYAVVEKIIQGEKRDTFWLIEDYDMAAAASKTDNFPKPAAARVFATLDKLKDFLSKTDIANLDVIEVKTGKAPAKKTGNVRPKKTTHAEDGKYCVTDFGSSKGFCFGRIERYCDDAVKALYLKLDPDADPKEKIYLAKPLKTRFTLDEIKSIYRHAVLRPDDLAYLEAQTKPALAAVKAGATAMVFTKGQANWAGKMKSKWLRTVEMIKAARAKADAKPVVAPVERAVQVKPETKAKGSEIPVKDKAVAATA